MMLYYVTWIGLAAAIATSVTAHDFWKDFHCDTIRDKLASNKAIKDAKCVLKCIFICFQCSSEVEFDVTPNQCFTYLLQPFITKVLKKTLPTAAEMQNCLQAKDRSNCKDTLLYYFAKWYKDHFSASHEKRFAGFLFYIWATNPDVIQTKVHSYGPWAHFLGKGLSKIGFSNKMKIQAALKITSPADNSQFPVVESEIKRHCYKPIADDEPTKEFCDLRLLLNIAKKIRILIKEKKTLRKDFRKYVKAVKCSFIPLSVIFDKSNAGDIAPPTKKEKLSELLKRLDELADLTKEGDTKKLQTFLQFMPETYLFDKACNQTTFPVIARRCCILSEVVGQLLIHSEMAEKRKQTSSNKAVTINFSLDLRKVITELRGEEVFKMMIENRYQEVSNQEETSNLLEGKFEQLKNYFVKLQSFNMQKASADVDYIKGRIDHYKNKTEKAVDCVDTHVGGVLQAAVATKSTELAEKVVKLAASIAQACNPFKVVFNGGTATDIMDATAELTKAISGLAGAVALYTAWTDVIETMKKISDGLEVNAELLSAMGRIVEKIKLADFPDDDEFMQCKSTFLRLYKEYTPKIGKEMLATLTAKFDTSVDAGCALINDATGAAANVYVATVNSGLYCQKAAVSTSNLQAIYEEIYDFQFEFIESMANYLQSATGYQASKKMVTITGRPITETDNTNERRNDLRANIVMAHTTYEIQKLEAIRSFCDFLEYKEGGRTPAVCKGANIDVPTLLSYIPRKCKLVDSYVSIPTSTSRTAKNGNISINQLYSGQEVSFSIPSYDWMKKYKWIGKDDSPEAVYIQSFEVFLPTVSHGRGRIEVSVRSLGGNRFNDDGTRYSLVPSESFSNTYTGGRRFFPCRRNKIGNPFSICEDRLLPKLCVLSKQHTADDATRLYPTAFSAFKIKAKGIRQTQAPDPQTPLDIKAGITMCVFDSGTVRERRDTIDDDWIKEGCCCGNNYWNEARNVCELCPRASTANLNGYYCEKNKQALSEKNPHRCVSS